MSETKPWTDEEIAELEDEATWDWQNAVVHEPVVKPRHVHHVNDWHSGANVSDPTPLSGIIPPPSAESINPFMPKLGINDGESGE